MSGIQNERQSFSFYSRTIVPSTKSKWPFCFRWQLFHDENIDRLSAIVRSKQHFTSTRMPLQSQTKVIAASRTCHRSKKPVPPQCDTSASTVRHQCRHSAAISHPYLSRHQSVFCGRANSPASIQIVRKSGAARAEWSLLRLCRVVTDLSKTGK